MGQEQEQEQKVEVEVVALIVKEVVKVLQSVMDASAFAVAPVQVAATTTTFASYVGAAFTVTVVETVLEQPVVSTHVAE